MSDVQDMGLVPSVSNFLNIVWRGYRRMREADCLVEPETFTDPEHLSENIEKIKLKGTPAEANYYRYDQHAKAFLKSTRLYEKEVFDKVDTAWQIMRHNPVVQTGHVTLSLTLWSVFSLIVFFMMWASNDVLNILKLVIPDDLLGPTRFFITILAALSALMPLSLARGMARFHCRDSNMDAYGAISSCIQSYNRKLAKAYKACLGRIEADEGPYAADEDIEKWPKRARDWMELALYHGKRSEMVDIYMDLNQWQNRNNYFLLSYYYLSYGIAIFYIISFIILVAIGIYWAYAVRVVVDVGHLNQFAIDYWCLSNIGVLIILALVTLISIDRELRQSYATVFETDGTMTWRNDIDMTADIKNQIYKDKVDIQHLKTSRVTQNH